MYKDQFKQYPQEYETNYIEEIEGSNQFYYDYNDPNIMMNEPLIERNVPVYRNQKYMNYQMNPSVAHSLHNNYNPGTQSYNPNRSIHNNMNLYGQSQTQYNMQAPNVNYTQQQNPNSSTRFVSIEMH